MNNKINIDILNCLTNISNDEVFTPPNVVRQMLDGLPNELWSNPEIRFLDPACKSGIFLREIAKRLMIGLEQKIPDEIERKNHILERQIYGIAITELTSLVSRRTVYDTKTEIGNIKYEVVQHTWDSKKDNEKDSVSCIFCGCPKSRYDRGETLENHAYNFIHTETPLQFFQETDMQFDVIIGNPPYQLTDDGHGSSAKPLYHLFIQRAKALNPKYISMIIPSRWFAGGKGLDGFRREMLNDNRLEEIHDFPETSECFPGVNIRGGVCYFLWNRNYRGDCKVSNHQKGIVKIAIRPLLEKDADSFVRFNDGVSILRKVQNLKEKSFSTIVSSRKPFGLATNFADFKKKNSGSDVILYRFGDNAFIQKEKILKGEELIDAYKIFVPYASPGGDAYPHLVLSKPIIAGKNMCCTETYLVVGTFESEKITKIVQQYMTTNFFRFMILLLKNTQHTTQKTYQFVPMQDFSESWNDEKLYQKYGLTQEEIQFIESMIKPMKV